MFGKIIKDSNFDIALKTINHVHGLSANFINQNTLLKEIGKINTIKNEIVNCNPREILELNDWIGFDESIIQYDTIEGIFKVCSYALVATLKETYTPAIYLDLSFISKVCPSEDLRQVHISSDDPFSYEKHYNNQKNKFINALEINNKIILMDGPLFSGIHTQFNFRNDSNVYIHFVKNSNSNQICDFLKLPQYNNDLHWAMNTLKPLQLSAIFNFTSADGRSKSFGYLKLTNNQSPIRIEIDSKHVEYILNPYYINTICHQYFANGLSDNLQPRLIELAEKYAREALNKSHVVDYLKKKNFIPTMNERRF